MANGPVFDSFAPFSSVLGHWDRDLSMDERNIEQKQHRSYQGVNFYVALDSAAGKTLFYWGKTQLQDSTTYHPMAGALFKMRITDTAIIIIISNIGILNLKRRQFL